MSNLVIIVGRVVDFLPGEPRWSRRLIGYRNKTFLIEGAKWDLMRFGYADALHVASAAAAQIPSNRGRIAGCYASEDEGPLHLPVITLSGKKWRAVLVRNGQIGYLLATRKGEVFIESFDGNKRTPLTTS